MPHTIVIVEDDLRLRSGFVEAINSTADLIVVGETDDLREATHLITTLRPSVLLTDIGLPGGSGLQLIRHAAKCVPECNIMVVTMFAEDRLVVECIEAGATGYLLKGSSGPDIVAQIRTLIADGSPISPTIAKRLLRRFTSVRSSPDPASELSQQERQVLSLSAKGYSYAEIARLLSLSSNTVETYVKRIYRKLQVHSKSEAIYEARKLGLVDG